MSGSSAGGAIRSGQWEQMNARTWKWSIELPLSARLHLPVEDGRIFDASAPVGFAWGGFPRASCVGVECPEGVRLLSVRDKRKGNLNVHAVREERKLRLDWTWSLKLSQGAISADNPPERHDKTFNSLSDAWSDHRQWIDEVYPVNRSKFPDWVNDIPACVMIEMWTGTRRIKHRYEDLKRLIADMRTARIPRHALLVFWGWHAPYDTKYPDYWPADELGGESAFAELADAARDAGYHLVPHTNHWGCDGTLPLYQQFKDDQLRDEHGQRIGWRVEGEPPIEYIRPTNSAWRDMLTERLRTLTGKYGIDTVFIDQIGFYYDDPMADVEAGARQLADQLHQACPGVAFMGEMFHDRSRFLPIYQTWGVPWCGLPVQEQLAHSDMLGRLFGGSVVMVGHEGMPAAVPVRDCWPSYYDYVQHHGMEEAARRAHAWHLDTGVVPTARVNYNEYGLDDKSIAILHGRRI
jgi:hypothetical protein